MLATRFARHQWGNLIEVSQVDPSTYSFHIHDECPLTIRARHDPAVAPRSFLRKTALAGVTAAMECHDVGGFGCGTRTSIEPCSLGRTNLTVISTTPARDDSVRALCADTQIRR